MNIREIFRTNLLEILHFDKKSAFASIKSERVDAADSSSDVAGAGATDASKLIVEEQRPASPFDAAFADDGHVLVAANVGADQTVTLLVALRKMNMFLASSSVFVCQQRITAASSASKGASPLAKFASVDCHCDG